MHESEVPTMHFLKSTNQQHKTSRSIIFPHRPLTFQETYPIGEKASACPEKICLWLSVKPCMHQFLHFLVTGKLVSLKATLTEPQR
jgi:hypothetical protein